MLIFMFIPKFNHICIVHVWDHSYSTTTTTSIQSVDENCAHDHSYYVKNTSVTKNCTDHSYVKNTSVTKIPVIDHSKAKAKGDLYFHLLINLANAKNSFHHLEHCNLKIDYCLHVLIETADIYIS
jgi:dihydrofolate reductase